MKHFKENLFKLVKHAKPTIPKKLSLCSCFSLVLKEKITTLKLWENIQKKSIKVLT